MLKQSKSGYCRLWGGCKPPTICPYLAKMDTVELVAVCDLFETRTQACMRLFGAKEQYLDYMND